MTFFIALAFMGIFFLSFFALVVKAHQIKLD
jgi:hypothetical protein